MRSIEEQPFHEKPTVERVRLSDVEHWIAVEVLEEQRRRKGWLMVSSRADLPMPACADLNMTLSLSIHTLKTYLEVEGAVNLVLLRAVDGGQVLRSRQVVRLVGTRHCLALEGRTKIHMRYALRTRKQDNRR